jgi:hypothetical protein
MFTYPTTQIAPGSSGASMPDEIFGSNLVTWFDARVGVTFVDNGGQDEVTDWVNQGTGGDASTNTVGQRPDYTASGSDGTPEVNFGPALMSLAYGDTVPDPCTCWVLMNATSTALGNLLWSNSNWSMWPQGLSTGQISFYNGGWFNATRNNSFWAVTRFSVRDNGVGSSRVTVDDEAESALTLNWTPGANTWAQISRPYGGQSLDGVVKQILVTDTFVVDADSEHQDVLDYFKDVYPTLVTY